MRAARLRRAVTRQERIRPGANECPGAIRPGLAPPWLNPNTDTFRRELPALEFFLPVPCDFLGAQMRLTNDNVFTYLEGRGLPDAEIAQIGDRAFDVGTLLAHPLLGAARWVRLGWLPSKAIRPRSQPARSAERSA